MGAGPSHWPEYDAKERPGLLIVTHLRHIQRKSRPWIAMAAAYAVALQMLFSVAVASQMAAAPAGTLPICYGTVANADGSGQGDAVLVHQVSCILCCVGLSGPVDLAAVAVAPVYFGKGIAIQSVSATPRLPQAPPSPRLSQGPPKNV
jgi:hypothetical protein